MNHPPLSIQKRQSFTLTPKQSQTRNPLSHRASTLDPQYFTTVIPEEKHREEDQLQHPKSDDRPYQDDIAEQEEESKQELGLGQLLYQSAKSSLQANSLRSNINPVLESIKNSFRSIIGTTAQAVSNSVTTVARQSSLPAVEESKSMAKLPRARIDLTPSKLSPDKQQDGPKSKDYGSPRQRTHSKKLSMLHSPLPPLNGQHRKESSATTAKMQLEIFSEPQVAKERDAPHVLVTNASTEGNLGELFEKKDSEQLDGALSIPVVMQKMKSQPWVHPASTERRAQANAFSLGLSQIRNPDGSRLEEPMPSDYLLQYGHLLT